MSARATTETPHAERAARALAPVPGAPALHERLSAKRWRHTLGVAETAHRLARAYGWTEDERERALRAALLHDVAKELPEDELGRLAREPLPDGGAPAEAAITGGVSAPGALLGKLLHAPAGARLAARDFGVRDPEVLRAIATHPTGDVGPSAIARLLFVSDYLEPGRPHLDDEARELLRSALAGRLGLRRLYCRVLHRKLGAMLERGQPVYPGSVAAWNAHCAGGD